MLNGRNVLDQPVKNTLITCDSIRNISIGQGDGCLLDYNYFNNFYKMIAIYLCKQHWCWSKSNITN